MEEIILFNTLKLIGTGREYDAAPDKEYLKSLEKIGLIKLDWNNTLTDFGRMMLNILRNRNEKW